MTTLDTDFITIQKAPRSRIAEVNWADLQFGRYVSDHMLVADYNNGEWQPARIEAYGSLALPPATLALHYGQTVFEGMKAFRHTNGISIFRIAKYHQRLQQSLKRMAMPPVPYDLFSEGIQALVSLDAAWVPEAPGTSLYIRPFMFATDTQFGAKPSETYKFVIFTGPVPMYFPKPLKVKVEDHFIRAAKGGTGAAKCGGNYGGAVYPTELAREAGFDQVLWTDGSPDLNIEESGAMNVMFVLGGKLVTPPLSDTILDGVTRDSVLVLAEEMGYAVEERPISAYELVEAYHKGALQEGFGVGTAAVTAPFELIGVKGKNLHLPEIHPGMFSVRVRSLLSDIRSGRKEDVYGWNTMVNQTW